LLARLLASVVSELFALASLARAPYCASSFILPTALVLHSVHFFSFFSSRDLKISLSRISNCELFSITSTTCTSSTTAPVLLPLMMAA
jgi:hypothetical protein